MTADAATPDPRRPYFEDRDATLWQGDAAETLREMPAQSVNCIVTSPPYFGLRDYGSEGQIGLEPSPFGYVTALCDVFAQAWRVLQDDGVIWLNLGDSYSTSPAGGLGRGATSSMRLGNRAIADHQGGGGRNGGIPHKNLMGIPWRVAFALQEDGWTLRQEVIWSKRNCMPEAVTDRPSRSHEQVFLFSKSRKYWYDADAIREESEPGQQAHNERYAKVYDVHTERADGRQPGNQNSKGIHSRPGKPGRNARSVWTVSSQPFPGAHFATMPPELARRCILAGCPTDGVVLDPFAGSGTTLMVARQLGRKSIGIDLSADYLDIAIKRIGDPTLDFTEAS